MSERLRRLLRRTHGAPAAEDRCELCSAPVPARHQHLMDLLRLEPRCACRACATVLGSPEAGGGHYRLVPERYQELAALGRDDVMWDRLRIPVALAFLYRRSGSGPVAVFPGALGPTEAPVDPDRWEALVTRYPAVAALQDDVEAVLVHRLRRAHDCWQVPIDACYRLVALVRAEWEGINGGARVWERIDRFFDDVRGRARSRPALQEVTG